MNTNRKKKKVRFLTTINDVDFLYYHRNEHMNDKKNYLSFLTNDDDHDDDDNTKLSDNYVCGSDEDLNEKERRRIVENGKFEMKYLTPSLTFPMAYFNLC
ncbi:hypothetical protein SNEBB_008644 [Seison nebaliae]|nr:hypothetical protein SNEBB_008644 [Seison nebaliae]